MKAGDKSSIDRAVIDTNIWYSGLIYGGKPAEVLIAIISRNGLVISDYIIEELKEHIIDISPSRPWCLKFCRELKNLASQHEKYDPEVKIRDLKDVPIVSLAVSQGAKYIITGDQDLLVLIEIDGVIILTPEEFIKLKL
jgi:putative PIN family toxin of toxin-antitoxin system